jgi:ABC-type sugar transport system permease subunit
LLISPVDLQEGWYGFCNAADQRCRTERSNHVGQPAAGLRASGIPWLFIVPSLVVMLVITFYPQAYQIYISFFDFQAQNLTDPGRCARRLAWEIIRMS